MKDTSNMAPPRMIGFNCAGDAVWSDTGDRVTANHDAGDENDHPDTHTHKESAD